MDLQHLTLYMSNLPNHPFYDSPVGDDPAHREEHLTGNYDDGLCLQDGAGGA